MGCHRTVSSLLEDKSASVQVAAATALGFLAEQGDELVFVKVISILEDLPWVATDMRSAAVKTLAQLARRGDERAVAAANECLMHPAASVRRAAVWALGEAARKGSWSAVASISSRL